MAKKQKFELDDDFDFGDDFNMPEMDFDLGEPKDDRSPATKFVGGVLSGVKDTVVSPSTIRKLAKEALPKGYGSAMDIADQGVDTLKSLYNSTAKELRPLTNDMKRSVQKILPAIEKSMPESISKRLKSWAVTSDQKKAQQDQLMADQKESAIQAQLAEVFGATAKQDHEDRVEDKAESRIEQGIEQARHAETMSVMGDQRMASLRGAAFQEKVMTPYYRKSLELQIRSYFLQTDAFEAQKKQNEIVERGIADLIKNTGLPDYAKLQNKEFLAQVMRNKFLDGLGSTLFEKRRDFMRNISNRVLKGGRQKMQDFGDQVRNGLGMVDQLADLHEMTSGMGPGGPSTSELAGNIAGSAVTDSLATRLGKWLRKHADKNEKLVKGGNKLQFGVENLPQLAGEWARGYKGDDLPIVGGAVRFLKDQINSELAGPDTGIEVDNLGGLGKPSVWTRQNSKSLDEIIPGLLSRILREVTVFRTGDETTDLIEYDYARNGFSDRGKIKNKILSSLVGSRDKESLKEEVLKLVKELDKDNKLSAEQQMALGRQLLKDNLSNQLGDYERYKDEYNYTGKAAEHSSAFADLFKEYFKDDPTGDKKTVFARQYNRLGSSMSDNRKKIQDYANVGNLQHLIELGIIDPNNNSIDMGKVIDHHLDLTSNPESRTPPTPTPPRAPPQMGPNDGPQLPPTPQGPRGPVPEAFRGLTDRLRRLFGGTGTTPVTPVPQVGPASPVVVVPSDVLPQADLHPNVAPSGTVTPAYIERLEKSIADNSSKSATEKVADILTRIEKKLEEGITHHHYRADGGAAAAPDGRLRDMRLRDLPGALMRLGGKGLGKLTEASVASGKMAKSALGAAWNFAGEAKDAIVSHLTGFSDVYVKGQALPVLRKTLMEAGKYRDQVTGEVIKSFRDIKGAVIDEDGNIILTVEEAKKAFIKTKLGAKLISTLGATFRIGKGLFTDGLKAVTGIYGEVGSWALKVGDKLLNGPQDVYIRGKKDPVLLAIVMKAGGYVSKTSGKTIESPRDIDGPIADLDGNVVLTTEQIASGLFDKRGRPIAGGFTRLFRTAKDLATGAFGMAMSAGKWAKEKALGAMAAVTDVFGKGFSIEMFNGKFSQKKVDLLTEIRDILRDRLPERKKKIEGDQDGDGVREGSYEDQLHKQQEAQAQQQQTNQPGTGAAAKTGMLGAAGAKMKGWWDRFRNRGKGDDEGGDTNVDVNVGGGPEGGPKGPKPPKEEVPKGFWNKVKHYGKRGGKGLWGATKWVAGTAASMLGLGWLPALASGAMTVGGALLSGAGAVIGGAMSLLASPVVLGGLAVAAVGAGAYYGYKYLTKKKLTPLSSVRYVQYGFPTSDDEHVQAVMELEDMLSPYVQVKGTEATLDVKKVDWDKAIKLFGVDKKNEQQAVSWLQWFGGRFKPVFLNHVAALKGIAADKTLADVEDLKPTEKQQYLVAIRMPDGPYGISVSPFPNHELTQGSTEVGNVYDVVKAQVDKDVEKEPKSADGKTPASTATKLGAAATVGAVAQKAGSPNTPLPPVEQIPDAKLNNLVSQSRLSKTLEGDRGVVELTAEQMFADAFGVDRIDALTAVRYKTYGLNEMAADKVRALSALEAYVFKAVKFKGTTASWSGSVEKAVMSNGADFGIAGAANTNAYNWVAWFNSRFLPVYLKYLTAIATATGKKTPREAGNSLKPIQSLNVANEIYTSKSVYNDTEMSVWQIPVSPWPGYALNMDVKSVDANIQGLKELAKNVVLEEEMTRKTGLDSSGNQVQSTTQSAWDRIWNGKKDASGRPMQDQGGSNFVSRAWNEAKSAMGFGEGREISHPGKGTGGDINALPKPTGNGSWAAMKELIRAAAKMVGVDEGLMASMAAIESGFNANAKAPNSSAKGLYQFIDDTWAYMLKKYGAKYGIDPGTSALDPRANALMGAEYIKENAQSLSSLGKKLTDTDLYLAHFLGGGDAKKFLSADPSAIGATVLPKAAGSNKGIFEANGKQRTIGEIYQTLNNLVANKAKQFGVEYGSEKVTTSTPTDKAPDAGPKGQAVTGATPAGTTIGQEAVNSGQAAVPAPASTAPAPSKVAIPIADQSPIPSRDNVPEMQTVTITGKRQQRENTPPDVVPPPMIAPSQAAQIAMQNSAREDLSSAMSTLNTTAGKQLETLQDVLKELRSMNKKIPDNLGSLAAAPATSAPPPPPQANQSSPQRFRPVESTPRAPVSMSKGG